jgi:hypothetical protein
MICWELPYQAQLAPVLEWCLENERVNRLLVAHRRDRALKKFRCPQAVVWAEELFGKRILERRVATRWPGTEMLEANAMIQVIDFDERLVQPMVEAADGLFDWVGWPDPPLPEDLCLYRVGNSLPTLVSVTHEHDAWIISEKDVSLDGVSKYRSTPENLMIPVGSPDFLE